MGCLFGIFRFLFSALWRVVVAAVLAILFARVDEYVERRYGSHPVGHVYRAWRGNKVRRGAPSNAGDAVEGSVRGDDPGKR